MGERRGTKALELWCRKCIEGYDNVRVDNMTTSWRNGLAFCALIHSFRPDLIDYAKLKKEDIYNNNELAFHVAEKYLSIPSLLDPADMLKYEVPDRLSILTYLSQYYQVFSSQEPASNNSLKKTNQEKPSGGSPPPKMAHIVGVPKREPCKKCGLPVFLAERLKISNNFYHRTCLRCARCDTQLTMGSFYETEVDNEFCCETCPDEEKLPAPEERPIIENLPVLKRPLSDEEKSSSLKRQNAEDMKQFVQNKKLNSFLTSQIDSSSSDDDDDDAKSSISGSAVQIVETKSSEEVSQFDSTSTSTPRGEDKNIITNDKFIGSDTNKLNKSSDLKTLLDIKLNDSDSMIDKKHKNDNEDNNKEIKSLENVTKDDNNISKSEFKLRLNKFESLSTSPSPKLTSTTATGGAASTTFNKYRHSISSAPAVSTNDMGFNRNSLSDNKLKSTSDNYLMRDDKKVPLEMQKSNKRIQVVNNDKLAVIDSGNSGNKIIQNKSSNDLVSVPNSDMKVIQSHKTNDDLQMNEILEELNVHVDESMDDLFEEIYNENAQTDAEVITNDRTDNFKAEIATDLKIEKTDDAEGVNANTKVDEKMDIESNEIATVEEPTITKSNDTSSVEMEEISEPVIQPKIKVSEDGVDEVSISEQPQIAVAETPVPTKQDVPPAEGEKLLQEPEIIYPTDLNPFEDDEESVAPGTTEMDRKYSNSSYNKSLNPFGDDEDEEEDVDVKIKKRISNNPFGSDSEDENDVAEDSSTSYMKRTPVPTPRKNLSVNLTPEPSPRLIRNAANKINTLYPSDAARLSENRFSGSSLSLTPHRKGKAPAPPPVNHVAGEETQSVSSEENSSFNSRRTSPYMKKKRPAPQPPSSTPKVTVGAAISDMSLNANDSFSHPVSVNEENNISDSLKMMTMSENSDSLMNLQSESKMRLIPLEASLKNNPDKLQEPSLVHDKEEIVTYRRKLVPLSPEATFTDESLTLDESEREREWEKMKDNKEALNRNRQSLDMSANDEYSDRYSNKSSHGKWKRRKGPAPVAVPPRRVLKMLPLQEIRDELELIEVQQQGLEKQGVTLEKMIRERCETSIVVDADASSGAESSSMASDKQDTPTKNTKEVEDLIMQLFDLVNEKNELFRRQAELMYLRRQHRLEQEQADLEYEIRVLMAQPERNKTDTDKTREEALITRLVEVVQMRNEVIECLEMDRIREKQEDLSIKHHIEIHTAKQDDDEDSNQTPVKLSKKEKKKQKEAKKLAKLKKNDADKDTDETEVTISPQKEKKKKKKFFILN